MLVDITVTATKRIRILKKTLDSFMKNMFLDFLERGHNIRLIINVDPIGNDGNEDDFFKLLRSLPLKYMLLFPTKPNFPQAFKTVWQNAETKYIFHLEDDWELMERVDLLELIDILEAEDDLAILRLAAFVAEKPRTSGVSLMKNWNKFFPYNGRYYECPEELKTSVGFCGHPSLIKGEFIKNVVGHIDESCNPEKQFHSRGRTPIMEEVVKWRYGVYSVPGSLPIIRDIGRKWMVENGYRKSGSKAYFTVWQNVT